MEVFSRFLRINLLLLFLFTSFVIPSSSSQIQSSGISISGDASEDFLVKYLDIMIIIHENDTVSLLGSASFEASRSHPSLKLEISYYGGSVATQFETAKIFSDVFFVVSNSSRHYSVGSYIVSLDIEPIVDDWTIRYLINLQDEVRNAQDILFPNETIEDCVILGTFNFEGKIENIIRKVEQNNFLHSSLNSHGNFQNIFLDITIPHNADLVDARTEEKDMMKISPQRVYESFDVGSLEKYAANFYLEWKNHSTTPLPMTYPYNYIISNIISVILGFGAKYVYDRRKSNKEKKKLVEKLILELKMNDKTLVERIQQISTTMYDTLISRLPLLDNKSIEIVLNTYQDLKRTTNRLLPITDKEVKEIRLKIEKSIVELKKEI